MRSPHVRRDPGKGGGGREREERLHSFKGTGVMTQGIKHFPKKKCEDWRCEERDYYKKLMAACHSFRIQKVKAGDPPEQIELSQETLPK